MGAKECAPRVHGGALRGGRDPVRARDLADRGGGDAMAQAMQLALDPRVAPGRIIAGEPDAPRPQADLGLPNANLDGFPRFMADRAEAERWRQTFTLYFGEVQGAPTPGWLGLHPGQ
jgi:hypothetical protein